MKRFLQAAFVCAALSFAVIGCEKKEEPKVEPAPVPEAPAPANRLLQCRQWTARQSRTQSLKLRQHKKKRKPKPQQRKKVPKKQLKTEVKSATDATTGVGTVQKRASREDEKPKVEEKPAQDPSTIKTVQKRKSRDD
jgi:hypothetical protein